MEGAYAAGAAWILRSLPSIRSIRWQEAPIQQEIFTFRNRPSALAAVRADC